MNKEVTYPVAKLLREKGYDLPCGYFYGEDGELIQAAYFRNHNEASVTVWSAPTIADAVMWLYEKHKIWVNAPFDDGCLLFYYVVNTRCDKLYANRFTNLQTRFKTPDEAYNAAIEFALQYAKI